MVLSIKFVILICLPLSSQARWSYHRQAEMGNWIGDCLIGKSQSPVALTMDESIPITLEPLFFEFYDQLPRSNTLSNTGYSVSFHMEAIREINLPQVVGGGLPGIYQFEQLHFHWGSYDLRGSEHTIDQIQYPMELHLVHFNTKYGSSMHEALSNSGHAYNTLAVLGIMFIIQEYDNPMLNPIIEGLDHIRYMNHVTRNITHFPLNHLLPHETSKFFRYNGSLTTPPCIEVVVWTVFQEPIPISERQMNSFRTLEGLHASNTSHHYLSDNYRIPQPLNGRKVFHVDTALKDKADAGCGNEAQDQVIIYVCIIVGFFIILVLIFNAYKLCNGRSYQNHLGERRIEFYKLDDCSKTLLIPQQITYRWE